MQGQDSRPFQQRGNKSLFASFSSEKEERTYFSEEKQAKRRLVSGASVPKPG
jgi:hypothetical protein